MHGVPEWPKKNSQPEGGETGDTDLGNRQPRHPHVCDKADVLLASQQLHPARCCQKLQQDGHFFLADTGKEGGRGAE